MALNFPHKDDVHLDNSPLIEVVCQVRFPPILRIADEEPSEFQEFIRKQFPELKLERAFDFRLPGPGAGGKATVTETETRIYRFYTADEQTTISLTTNFYALATTSYDNWENFAQYLSLVHEAVQSIYSPTYATRIGLRYINRLTLENTNSKTIDDILNLLRPELTAQLRSEAWVDPIEMLSRLVLVDDKAKLTLGTRYEHKQGNPYFLLDFDYFEEGKLDLINLLERCRRYNIVIYDAFRWCIKDDELQLFNPKPEESVT